MAIGVSSSSPRGSRRQKRAPMADINVTPLVDVMLVLLIIFMVTAPLMAVGVAVDLPQTEAAQLTESEEPLVVSLDQNGVIYLQEAAVKAEDIIPKLQAITNNNREARIYVRGDRKIPYGRVMEVMGLISAAGFSKVTLVAEQP